MNKSGRFRLLFSKGPSAQGDPERGNEAHVSGGTGRKLTRKGAVAAALAFGLVVALGTTLGIEGPHGIAAALGLTSSPPTGGPSAGSTTTSTDATATSPGSGSTTGAPTPEDLAPVVAIPGGSTPGHGSFNAVTCTSSVSCVAVGADPSGSGVASSTTNSGHAWTNAALPAGTSTLNSVTCPSSSSCIAVGQGVIVSTADGGKTWSGHAPSAQTTLLGISCAAEEVCLAVGISPNPTGEDFGVILRSTDAGATWSANLLPTGSPGLEAVTCPTATRCVAVGAAVLTSSDAGATWQPQSVGGGVHTFESIACASATYCVAIGANPQGLSDASAPAFSIVSKDGGSSWDQLTLPAGSAPLHIVTCPTATSCVAAGPNIAGTYTGAPTYSTSSDGGVTWTMAPPPTGISDVAGLACSASTSCIVVGRTGTTSESASTPDGSTWTVTALPASASSN